MGAVSYQAIEEHSPLALFREKLAGHGLIDRLREGLVGSSAEISGPYGRKPLLYADYVASGRALRQIEDFIIEEVLPYYANSHTEASYCGGFMTRLRRDARSMIASYCGAGKDHAVIFTGSGATAGINRLVKLFGIPDVIARKGKVRVVVGPYEHHSNILPWRETGAAIVEVDEIDTGGPDPEGLHKALTEGTPDLVICALSAASNVTGILTDVEAVTREAKRAGAKIIWDYAGGGPYLPISMNPGAGAEIDAIVVSPHKFIGGPGSSGVLIVRRDAVVSVKPSWPGGGTVRFVSAKSHDYSDSIEAREEAGTPNVVGDIRSALAFIVKDAIGDDMIRCRNEALTAKACEAWGAIPNLELLGPQLHDRLPIFSFRIRNPRGGFVHQQLVTRMLSDRFGIQARGGCACAGPYVHRLLHIGDDESEIMRQAILSGDEIMKPGFTRLNFSVLLSEEKVDFILQSVRQLASDAAEYEAHYDFDPARAIFFPRRSGSEA